MSNKIYAFTLALSLGAIMLPALAAQGREDLVIGQVAPLTATITGNGNEAPPRRRKSGRRPLSARRTCVNR